MIKKLVLLEMCIPSAHSCVISCICVIFPRFTIVICCKSWVCHAVLYTINNKTREKTCNLLGSLKGKLLWFAI